MWLEKQEQQNKALLLAGHTTDCSTGLALPHPQHPAGAALTTEPLTRWVPEAKSLGIPRSPFAHLLPGTVTEMKSHVRKCSVKRRLLYLGKVMVVLFPPTPGDSS